MAKAIDLEFNSGNSTPTSEQDTLKSNSENTKNVQINSALSWLRTFGKFMGPGYMVAVGYLDPGNWATDLSAGSLVHDSTITLVWL